MAVSNEEDLRKQLSADVKHGTLTQEQTERMMRDSYERRAKRDRARNAFRAALGRVPMEEKVKGK